MQPYGFGNLDAASDVEHRFRIVRPASAAGPLEEFGRIGRPQLAEGGLRVAIKPNLTWNSPRPGVTTTVEAIRLVASDLVSAGNRVLVVESNGGYGSFSADDAFDGHGLRELAAETGVQLLNLSTTDTKEMKIGGVTLGMARPLLEEVDCIVNMPVPKVHVMTRYTGALKNQWGLIPSDMRLRKHYKFQEILFDMLQLLPPQVVAMDGTYFLNRTGPLTGDPVKKNVMIFAEHPLVADIVALRMMGWTLDDAPYLRGIARRLGMKPGELVGLPDADGPRFTLDRTQWDRVALMGFKSRILTYVGYESVLAGPLHSLKRGAERAESRLRSRRGNRDV
jgi:uncharacterized protein (DUF362 family)